MTDNNAEWDINFTPEHEARAKNFMKQARETINDPDINLSFRVLDVDDLTNIMGSEQSTLADQIDKETARETRIGATMRGPAEKVGGAIDKLNLLASENDGGVENELIIVPEGENGQYVNGVYVFMASEESDTRDK